MLSEHRGITVRFRRPANVNRHLVAVEVRAARGANERVDADRFASPRRRLAAWNAEAVQRGSAVEQNGMLADDIFENIPDDRFLRFDELFRLLNRGAVAGGFELVIDERLEKLEGPFQIGRA